MKMLKFKIKTVTYSSQGNLTGKLDFCNFFFEKPTSSPAGYLGHSALTPGSFSISYTKTLFKVIPTSRFMAWLGYILLT